MKHPGPPLREPAEDRGAALVLVLVIVTVIGLAGAALLDFSYTSIRTTFALRDQAAATYAADGAGQVAVAKLAGAAYQKSCATVAGYPLSLGDGTTAFYSTDNGATSQNAYVTCTPDTTSGTGVVIGPDNTPADAVFTVGDDTGVKVPGQDYGRGAANKTVTVSNGNVISKSSIDTGKDTLAVRSVEAVTVLAMSQSGCIGEFKPTPCKTGAAAVRVPSYPPPTDPVTLAPAPVCLGDYAAFQPGLYTDVAYLNGPCSKKKVVWFSPGTYYFDFPDSWAAPNRLIGGTPTDSKGKPIAGLDPTNPSTLSNLSQLNPSSPGACANPGEQNIPNGGVVFVFGGVSRIDLGKGKLEICATYSATSVPIAIYGPTEPILVNGETAVSAETVCKEDDCSLFQNSSDGQAAFNIMGLTYAPNARMYLKLKNSDGQNFNWGLVLRSLALAVNGSSPTGPVVQVPEHHTSGTTNFSIMYLNVWVCPKSASACAHSPGSQQLRAKVQVTGSPATVKVLSWSVQR